LWQAISAPESLRAVGITLWCSIVATVINTVMGTATAWVLVRDTFRGQFLLQGLVDIPFALPTVVAGVTLMTLYGPNSALHIHLVGTWMGIAVALLFVTLPFCVRTVQPVLESLTRSAEDASLTLGASAVETFRYVTLPRLVPSMATGAGLAFARALGEFGSVVFISGNRPFHTEVGSSYIFMLSQSQRFNEAAAVSLELMVVALGVLTGIHFLTLRRSVRRTR
jgi:sulfate transport system permease protein